LYEPSRRNSVGLEQKAAKFAAELRQHHALAGLGQQNHRHRFTNVVGTAGPRHPSVCANAWRKADSLTVDIGSFHSSAFALSSGIGKQILKKGIH
jgi:hypothetical protein